MLFNKICLPGLIAFVLAACASPTTQTSVPLNTEAAPATPSPSEVPIEGQPTATAEPPTTVPEPTAMAEPATAPAAATAETIATTQPSPTAPTAPPAPTKPPPTLAPTNPPILSGRFVDQEFPANGSYSLDPAGGVLHLSGDFGTREGPDLRVILSGAGEVHLDYVTFSKQVGEAPRVYLGALISISGGQSYGLPAGADLSLYKSVVIWCEAFSVAFAAAPLNANP